MNHQARTIYLSTLARLAPSPETSAIYSARAELASAYAWREMLESSNGVLFGRIIPRRQRYMSERAFETQGER